MGVERIARDRRSKGFLCPCEIAGGLFCGPKFGPYRSIAVFERQGCQQLRYRGVGPAELAVGLPQRGMCLGVAGIARQRLHQKMFRGLRLIVL